MQSSNGSGGCAEADESLEGQTPFVWKSHSEGRDSKSLILTSGPAQKGKVPGAGCCSTLAGQLSFEMKILALLLAATLLPSTASEHTVAKNVQFFVTKDRKLRPVLPVEFTMVQETGGIIDDQMITCEVVARHVGIADTAGESRDAVATVLKCGDRILTLSVVTFTPTR